jgi:ATP-dependent helicase/nuclease subunit B
MAGLFTIPAHRPFLPDLAAGLLARAGGQPLALARMLVLLPTRRAARALAEAFLPLAGKRALLLPRMAALPGLAAEEAEEDPTLPVAQALPPAVAPARRQAVLAGFLAKVPSRFGGPATPDQAWRMAAALAAFFDEAALEGCDLDALDSLVPEELARHWQITLALLRPIAADWRAWLAEQGLLDIGERRVALLRAQAEAWRRTPPPHPVIAAGIGAGGTIPAATEVLRVIAGLPDGAIVFPGSAEPAEEALWDAFRAAPSHPFAGQARLLQALGAQPQDLRPWGAEAPVPGAPPARAALLAAALRPPGAEAPWRQPAPERWRPGLAGLSRLAAADAAEEAAAIALLLRDALERPGARVALVTPDRDLARRVSAECARHGITVDDSAGEPLAETPAAAFLRLLARMVGAGFAPVPLLACLKHPLAAGGMDRADWLAAVRRLEVAALRGARPAPGLAALRALGGEEARPLLDRLADALGDFTELPEGEERPPADLLAAHLAAAERLATSADRPGALRLYAGEEGEPLARHLADLAEALADAPPIAPAAWPALFDALLEGPLAPSVRAVRGRGGDPHPRVAILGLLEARLGSFDRVVLAGLEEGVWPRRTDPGPWMSRPMRRAFGLPEPEAHTGREAADFFALAAASTEVVLSAARRREGAPTVPARWLSRLEAFLSGQGGLALPRSPAAAWAAALDRPAVVTPCARPAPAPPAALRPRRLSPSTARQLIGDPYAFYAAEILRLRRLPALDEDLGAVDFGIAVHQAMARFLAALGSRWPGREAAAAAWAKAAEAAIAAIGPRPALAAFWRPRLQRIGTLVIAEEEAARGAGGVVASGVEISGQIILNRPRGRITLFARADRIDRLASGGFRILDVKTGRAPTRPQVLAGSAPQLPIEAAILEGGGFPGIPAGASVAALLYWRLTGGTPPGEITTLPLADADGQPLAEVARARIGALADRFLLGEAPFLSRPHPDKARRGFGEYDHLARVLEWAAAEENGG